MSCRAVAPPSISGRPGVRRCLNMLCPVGALTSVLFVCVAAAAEIRSPRVRENIDFDWRFNQGDISGGQAPDFLDVDWRTLDLPHDWSIEGEYKQDNPAGGTGAYLPYGVGWYRKTFEMAPGFRESGKRVFVEVDAATMVSELWINGRYLGKHHYGGISFAYDLTSDLKAGRNVLAVRIDNSLVPNARWYSGSGLYAHVHLVTVNPVHVAPWGTYVTTPEISSTNALVKVRTEVANQSGKPANVRLVSEVVDPKGRSVASGAIESQLLANGMQTISQSLPMPAPQLWSPETPLLYDLITRIYSGVEILDEYHTRFGVRSCRFKADTGFWLNGKNLKLQGVGIHYCGGPLGVAIPDKILRAQLLQFKGMGCNIIRTGTRPFPPLFYDLCDEIGLMVADEAFDGWRRKAAHDYGGEAFAEHWQTDLKEIICRDRNHPSVVLWSIGNETGEEDRHNISGFVHALDPTRPTTGGQCLLGVDVSGFTGRGEIPGVLDNFHAEHPTQPILLMEETHGYQTRGYYRTLSWWRDLAGGSPRQPFPPYAAEEVFKYGGDPQYNSSYDNSTVRLCARMCWKRTRETPWIAGEIRWAGMDYLGEASFAKRHWPARYGNPGLIDSAGIPKDIYYFYQSQWTTAPMVHLLPHWTHPLVELGTKVPIVAYSNCEEVELFLNGRSLGRQKPRGLLDFVWQVPYEPGEIKAVGYKAGRVAVAHGFRTAGTPALIKLQTDHTPLAADQRDVTTLDFSVVDEKGELVPWAHDRLEFKLLGPARLLGFENGDNLDVTPHRVSWRKVFAGLGRGFFGAAAENGAVELVAAGILGNRRFQETSTVALAVSRVSLRGPLPAAVFGIRYTVDGSEPAENSPVYERPFTLDHPANIRMLVLRDGRPFIRSQAQFDQGPPATFDDPRFEKPAAVDAVSVAAQDFARQPHDTQVAGLWIEGKRQYRLSPDGTVTETKGAENSVVGRWWYDFPDDIFENPTAVGRGEVQWFPSGRRLQLQLEDATGKSLLLRSGTRERRWLRPKISN